MTMTAPAIRVAVMVSPCRVMPPMCHSWCSPTLTLMAATCPLITSLPSRGGPEAAEDRHGRPDKHQDLEDGEPDEDAEAVRAHEQAEPDREQRDQPEPGEHAAPELLLADLRGAGVADHRGLEHPVVERAERDPDAAEHPRQRVAVHRRD